MLTNFETYTPTNYKMTFQQQEHFHTSSTGEFTPLNDAQKRKKVVTMKPTVIIHDIDATVSQEEKSELYYTKDDLVMTNLEIKAICALSKHLPQTPYDDIMCSTSKKDSKCWLAVEADGFLRGLEFHIYPLRFRNKLLARRDEKKFYARYGPYFAPGGNNVCKVRFGHDSQRLLGYTYYTYLSSPTPRPYS